MPTFTQSNRALQVTTPLGADTLLVTGFRGTETLSSLFLFEIDLIAENSTQVDFSKLVGKEITLKVSTPGSGSDSEWRYVDGICAVFSQGERNDRFTRFTAEVVPKVWLLTQQSQSRIFQQKSVPDILKAVLTGIDCSWKLQGQYEPREYCVQYRETDFDFASRLMEEEGIYYYFDHSESGHKMIVADTPQGHDAVPGLTTVRYGMVEGGARKADHIYEWRKIQSLRTAKYTLWDHNFQQPTQNLEAKTDITDSVQAGTVSHKLKDSTNGTLERYDFPGAYAVRFDGVSPSGGAQSSRLQKILDDKDRTVKLRMQAAAVETLQVDGKSSCANFVAGHKFTLDRHFDADGDYVLVTVCHESTIVDGYTSGAAGEGVNYRNTFSCIPFQLPYRPAYKTPRPFVHGVQNAIVTGPGGDEIFTDKYGRVKVQFYWDRQGKKDANSSCWLRVGTTWAGKQWGFIQIPRIGQEVLVAFVEGNPDEPVIVGSVWNPETMPTYALPDNKTRSGVQTRSSMGGAAANYNEIRFEDKKGSEELYVHAEKDQNNVVEHDETTQVGHDRTENVGHDEKITIGNNRTEQVGVNEMITIGSNRTEKVGVNETITIGSNRTETVGANESITVAANRTRNVGQNEAITVGQNRVHTIAINEAINVGAAQAITVGAARAVTVGASQTVSIGADLSENIGNSQSVQIGTDLSETIGNNHTENVSQTLEIQVGKDGAIDVKEHLSLVAGEQIILKTGDASITMKKDGSIEIKGKDIKIDGSGKIVATADSDMVLKGSSKITLN
jgi:type VI secretion system secreted protein VgrG